MSEPSAAASPTTTAAPPGHPGRVLLDLIVTLLAPMFLSVTGGDVDLAHAAALETINDYRARSRVDLICIGQIIAFGLASISTIGQSMDEALPPETTLRLHASADTLSRGAERSRKALDRLRRDPPPPPAPAPDDLSDAEVFAQVKHARQLTARPQLSPTPQSPATPQPSATPQPQPNTAWAAAFADVAQEIAAGIPHLPPQDRRTARIQAAALSTASTLIAGARPQQSPPA